MSSYNLIYSEDNLQTLADIIFTSAETQLQAITTRTKDRRRELKDYGRQKRDECIALRAEVASLREQLQCAEEEKCRYEASGSGSAQHAAF